MWDISLFNQVTFSKMQQLSAFTRGCRTFIAIYVTYLGDDMLVGWGKATFDSFIFALAHLKSVSVMEKRGFTSSICAVSRCRACMQGAAAILRRADAWRELLQSKFPFLCARTIYNSAIELFMCLHRLSLDATGHVWEGGNVFMALFLISQAIFFPLPFSPPTALPLYMASKSTRRSALP